MHMLSAMAFDQFAPHWELNHQDGSRYLERTVLAGLDCLDNHSADVPLHIFVHRIHTPDSDRHMHNHPWRKSVAVVLSGGYTEARTSRSRGPEHPLVRTYGVGDFNILEPDDYHSIKSVLPDTVTLFIGGAETQDWGFLVDSIHVPHAEYFKRSDAQHMSHRRIA